MKKKPLETEIKGLPEHDMYCRYKIRPTIHQVTIQKKVVLSALKSAVKDVLEEIDEFKSIKGWKSRKKLIKEIIRKRMLEAAK